MRKLFVAMIVFSALVSAGIFAQVAADPHDFFYDDLNLWETMGIVTSLPAQRPYPLPLVKSILETVVEKGDAYQRKVAEAHHRRIFGRILSYGGKGGLAIDSDESRKQMDISLAFDLNYVFGEYVSASASVDGWATNKLPDEEILPVGQKSEKDVVEDDSKAGPFWILPSVDSSIAVGTEDFYLNAGLMRGSWGPFYENGTIYSQQAHHSGQFNIAYNRPDWCYNMSLMALSATPDSDTSDFYSDKFLSIHSLDYRPFSFLSISIFETVVYGGRLEPMYMIPVAPYMISQGNAGFNDNCYLGGTFTVRPYEGIKVDGSLLVDDASFNDVIKFKFDTKWRIAGQLGVSYAPRKSGLFTLLSLDYTMVTPYTYSHKEGENLDASAPNYQNYTHAGNSVGAALDPNSDRVNLRLRLRPLEGVDFDVVGTLIRHGNVNEGMDDKRIKEYVTTKGSYTTDGTILNSSGTNSGHAFFYSTPFLSQETIQYVWQTGFDVICRLPVLKTGGYMVFRLGYRFEINVNPWINEQVYTYDENLVNADGTLVDDATIKAAAREQLEVWRENATGQRYNNYISAGMEYYF